MADMSSRCWQLSKTLAFTASSLLAQSFVFAADKPIPEIIDAAVCIRMAALSVADQEAETAERVTAFAIESCHKEIEVAGMRFHAISAAQGNNLSSWEHRQMLTETFRKDTENYVIKARSAAHKQGANAYLKMAERLAERRLDLQGVE